MATKYKKSKLLNTQVLMPEGIHPHSIHRVPAVGYRPNPEEVTLPRRPNAGLAAKHILGALESSINYSYDTTVRERLKDFIKWVGIFNPWYKFWILRATERDIKNLIGFKLNALAPLEHFLKVPFEAFIDQEKTKANFNIPSFIPSSDINWPDYNSIARIRTILTGINLRTGDFETVITYSDHITSDMTDKCTYTSANKFSSKSFPLLIYCCGINFYQPLSNKKDAARILDVKYNPMDVVAVEYKNKLWHS